MKKITFFLLFICLPLCAMQPDKKSKKKDPLQSISDVLIYKASKKRFVLVHGPTLLEVINEVKPSINKFEKWVSRLRVGSLETVLKKKYEASSDYTRLDGQWLVLSPKVIIQELFLPYKSALYSPYVQLLKKNQIEQIKIKKPQLFFEDFYLHFSRLNQYPYCVKFNHYHYRSTWAIKMRTATKKCGYLAPPWLKE